ncbi:alpha/beta hydrolase [Chelativorans intermedius]|uniref:Alpha/beta hydrolase n=1 Tax=Chelativorans intermedius TaxID=515947 RepID=A0ABV6D9N5_9HYPH|nr:alpha/beta-hydrolase family protein [Chelativorans intermedius]MCT8998565.1 alpha/beta-hydrolase family protein [Chelativorans intermedius]
MNFWRSFSATGLLIGTFFFAASLTPSLLPRNFLTQGVLSGVCFAAGYGIGVFGRWLAAYLELRGPSERALLLVKYAASVICAFIAGLFLWQASEWQNSIRGLMGLEPLDTANPVRIIVIAALTFLLVMAVARLFRLVLTFAAARLRRFVPRRLANVLGVAAAVLVFWLLIDGVLLRQALRMADSSFQTYDELIEPERERPEDPSKTGSAASLVAWQDLGRAGREFIASGPSAETIGAFWGEEAIEPLRVYVGINAADTPQARARLALEELIRIGGFERSVLVIVMPTGTGWIDPAAMDTLEYLHRGDVASVAIQYSYLTSWLSLLVEPEYGAEAARALFNAVYGHWTSLPADSRPRLYLHGLSLGTLNSELSSELYDVLGDPYHGALWSGPPFASRIWHYATNHRNPDTPAWLPRFRDSSAVRFTNQDNALDIPGAEWGPMRIVYLQYASDPVTFFDHHALYREPEWMAPPRGPDVSPHLRWYPVVTLLQIALDMALATTAPMGHGHVYAPEHYIDAWIEVTGVRGLSDGDVTRLKRLFLSEREG